MATILLIDGDVVERHLYRDLLYYNGFDVMTAGDASTGIRMAIKQRPDLIVLDIMLPGINGLATAQRLRHTAETSDIPVICMSAYDTSPHIVTQSGAREFLAKPVDPSALVKAVWRHLGRGRTTPRPPT